MPGGEEPVREREAEVVPVELDECRAEGGRAVQRLGEGVRLELKPPAQRRHAERQDLQTRMGYSAEITYFLKNDCYLDILYYFFNRICQRITKVKINMVN